MRILSKLDRLWSWGRGETYVRLYPNPGFSIKINALQRVYWSWHRGWSFDKRGGRRLKNGTVR